MTRPCTVLFAGGGTGGHLFPGIAIAEALRQREPAARISFAGSARKIEATVVPKRGYEFDAIWISGFRRRFSFETALLPLKVLVSLWQSMRLIRTRKPDVVVGTGGYVSGPVVYMASKLGTPTLIQEQNEFPGVTTRMLAGRVDEVHVTFASTLRHLPSTVRAHVTGNPVRPSLARVDSAAARAALGLDPERRTLFVFGGSLGAASINGAVLDMLARLTTAGVQVLWQTGSTQYAAMRAAVTQQPGVVLRDFIDDMNLAYSAADLVVCRAGATSIAELTALGIPAVLVPYPYAAGDHQTSNAQALASTGAALLLRDSELARLCDTVLGLLDDDAARTAMAAAAASMGRPRAAEELADAVLRLAEPRMARRR